MRIQDIIYELSAQLEPLKEQAEKRQFIKAKAESDQLEINLLVHNMEDVQRNCQRQSKWWRKQLRVLEFESLKAKNESHIEDYG